MCVFDCQLLCLGARKKQGHRKTQKYLFIILLVCTYTYRTEVVQDIQITWCVDETMEPDRQKSTFLFRVPTEIQKHNSMIFP